jgi:hypothetical protein
LKLALEASPMKRKYQAQGSIGENKTCHYDQPCTYL